VYTEKKRTKSMTHARRTSHASFSRSHRFYR